MHTSTHICTDAHTLHSHKYTHITPTHIHVGTCPSSPPHTHTEVRKGQRKHIARESLTYHSEQAALWSSLHHLQVAPALNRNVRSTAITTNSIILSSCPTLWLLDTDILWASLRSPVATVHLVDMVYLQSPLLSYLCFSGSRLKYVLWLTVPFIMDREWSIKQTNHSHKSRGLERRYPFVSKKRWRIYKDEYWKIGNCSQSSLL